MARPREFDEASVLRAAQGVFRRAGYGGATLSDLTAATGLNKSSLYGAFGSKHGLYLAALDDYRTRRVDEAREDLTVSEPALVALRRYLLELARGSTVAASPSCLLNGAATELAGHDGDVAARVRETFEDLSAAMAAGVRAAQAEGDIDPAADPDAVADVLLATSRGLDVLGHGGLPRRRLERAVDAALAAFGP